MVQKHLPATRTSKPLQKVFAVIAELNAGGQRLEQLGHSDHLPVAKVRDLAIAVSQLAEYLLRVLTHQRRPHAILAGGRRQTKRCLDELGRPR
jgi:hypothetical protein